jgi:hypothetical protein
MSITRQKDTGSLFPFSLLFQMEGYDMWLPRDKWKVCGIQCILFDGFVIHFIRDSSSFQEMQERKKLCESFIEGGLLELLWTTRRDEIIEALWVSKGKLIIEDILVRKDKEITQAFMVCFKCMLVCHSPV